ncbi:hypothetical protein AB5N19_09128 [Seiridium cardinale]|uniref:Uncharacterized protein n=1 Tax=Seiridium cardinale TaxID=138064 RepID=A0ABR2Y745_9PEZI
MRMVRYLYPDPSFVVANRGFFFILTLQDLGYEDRVPYIGRTGGRGVTLIFRALVERSLWGEHGPPKPMAEDLSHHYA